MSSSPSTLTSPQFDTEILAYYGLGTAEADRAGRQDAERARDNDKRRALYLAAKRALDIAGALAALVVLSPVFAVVALLIKLRDRGPVLFVQKRVGKGGTLFNFYKFRSMVVGAERQRADLLLSNDHGESITFKMKRDPRITWIGRIIRRASIDELPQFLNVLKGDMTLVGPRPALPCEVEQYSDSDRRRLEVTPGLTCIWQISGRAILPFHEQVRLDVNYIERQSFLFDLEILARTIPAVLSGRGAY
jgi:lipopolysaccharide/colanic/teichoic acid biosynthesis glycosyltransferase